MGRHAIRQLRGTAAVLGGGVAMTIERRPGHEAEEAQETDEVTPLRVLSLGAGVQSSTLLLMAVQGELDLDAAIFADTQWEPAWVYDHLTSLELEARRAGIPLHRVTAGSLRE